MTTAEAALTGGPNSEQDQDTEQSKAGAAYLVAAQTRRLELQGYHIINQIHTLPFPYLSQIYHLLNLSHLETVHSSSLGSLKVIDVGSIEPTPLGGLIKFRTSLNSPINVLRFWRQAVVDVELILHTPHMVELKIPVYGGRRMVVIFNVQPLSDTSHQLSIDIYTDLKYPRFLLSTVLHLASLITLYEDMPYLKKLSNRKLDHLLNPAKSLDHKTMGLLKRFVDLYAFEMQPS
jgi:hypothetical protein